MKKQGISLKYKLLGLLVTLPVVSLALYLVLATRLFEEDKIAYVFDSSASASRALSNEMRTEVTSVAERLRFLAARRERDSSIEELLIFPETARSFKTGFESYRSQAAELPQTAMGEFEGLISELARTAIEQTVSLRILKNRPEWVGISINGVTDPRTQGRGVLVALVDLPDISRIFKKGSIYSAYLVDNAGKIISGTPEKSRSKSGTAELESFDQWSFFTDLKHKNVPEGTLETLSPDHTPLLASYSKLGIGGMLAITLVRKADALRAVDILLWKSLLFFVALISFATIISVFASGKLTSTLRELDTATRKVSEGQFDIQVPVRSRDEVGNLADSFNRMAMEVSRLMSETADKARMEKELETAKTVQETLFPNSEFAEGPIKLKGYYQPASECGGDWWHYCKVGRKVMFWIGDATGHGAPAALLTSAAKSAATVIEKLAIESPARAMEIMNSAIHETSKGKILMTFFIACFDPATGEFVYSNASHEAPFLFKCRGQKLSKKDVEPLNEVNSPRLGDDLSAKFEEAKVKLEKGDMLLFYTDGVGDVKGPDGQAWGASGFLKFVLSSASSVGSAPHAELGEIVAKIHAKTEEIRKGTELPDDVTFFFMQFDGATGVTTAPADHGESGGSSEKPEAASDSPVAPADPGDLITDMPDPSSIVA